MTSIALTRPRRRAARDATWLLTGLTVLTVTRAALNGQTAPTAFVAGSAFGIALVTVAVAAGWRPALPRVSPLFLGTVGGLALIAIPRLAHPLVPAAIGMRPEPFLVWGAVTVVVVVGEEALLRGALFGAIDRGAGPLAAVLLTSLAFSVMHVPLYGWQVVPLDLGVGIFLGGLRLATGGVAAPAMAHLLADLSTWWP